MLSIIKTTAIGAVMGATLGIGKKYVGSILNRKNVASNDYIKYTALSSNKEYTDYMDELKKFTMYSSDKDIETILRCLDRFLSIPDAIIVKKQFGLIRWPKDMQTKLNLVCAA